MFTGLVEAIGIIRSLEQRGDAARLTLETSLVAELSLGESLAVNGCCLTISALEPASNPSFSMAYCSII